MPSDLSDVPEEAEPPERVRPDEQKRSELKVFGKFFMSAGTIFGYLSASVSAQ